MRSLKLALSGLLILVSLTLAALGLALVLVDPNDYKQELEQIVHKQSGLNLELSDISWQFFPNIGLALSKVRVSDPEQKQKAWALVQASKVSIKLALLPLLQNEIHVQSIQLEAPLIQYIIDVNGNSNWDRLSAASSEQEKNKKNERLDTMSEQPAFKVEVFEINQARFKYIDRQIDAITEINKLDLRLNELALGKKVHFNLAMAIQQNANLDLFLDGKGQFMLGTRLRQFELDPFELNIHIQNAPDLSAAQTATLSLAAKADLEKDSAQIHRLSVNLSGLKLEGTATLSQLTQNTHLSSKLRIAAFSPKQWLEQVLNISLPATEKASSFDKLAFSTDISGQLSGNQAHLHIAPIKLNLDRSALTGKINVDLTTFETDTQLRLDTINLDDYLPPSSPHSNQLEAKITETDESSTQSNQKDKAKTSPLIPLEPLRPLNAKIALEIEHIIYKSLDIDQVKLNAKAREGLIELEHFGANLLGGSIQTQGVLDVRAEKPKIKLEHVTQTLQLQPVVLAFLGKDLIDGSFSLSANMSSEGNSAEELMNGLIGNSLLKLDRGTLKTTNITKIAYDKLDKWRPLVNSLADKEQVQESQPIFQKDTQIKNLLAKLNIKDGKIHLNDIEAEFDGSDIQGAGEIDIASTTGSVQLNLKLSQELSNPTLAKVRWPVVCAFNTFFVPTCQLDSRAVKRELEQIAKRRLEDEAQKAITDKINKKLQLKESTMSSDAMASDAAKEKIRKEKERAKEKAREALKKLF